MLCFGVPRSKLEILALLYDVALGRTLDPVACVIGVFSSEMQNKVVTFHIVERRF